MDTSLLNKLGWNEWFDHQSIECESQHTFARVITVDRDQYTLSNAEDVYAARLSGRFIYQHESSDEHPCVGDWVCVSKTEHDDYGVIHQVLKRQSHLRRKAVGESVDVQMISSNIDVVIIVQSCHYDFNIKRLERYLVMVREGGATPVILLTKTDLITPQELDDLIDRIKQSGISEAIIPISNISGDGVDSVKALLQPTKTYTIVGSSGVGKSTLINRLMGEEQLETKHVSDSGEGRHTTVRRQLMILKNGAIVIDNPGMREFGVLDVEDGITASYSDISSLASQCRFSDCSHSNEPGCAVLKAIDDGEIDIEHYHNFIKLRSESDFYQMSYAEKRQKDKDFGKYIKNAKKDLRKR